MVARGANYDRRENDLYATPAWVSEVMLRRRRFAPVLWDPCCGDGAMLRVFVASGYRALGSDIHPVGLPDAVTSDFLADGKPFPENADIFTKPPYGKGGRLGVRFIERALEVTRPYLGRVAMLLPVDYDSAKTRQHVFGDHPAFAGKIVLTRRIIWVEAPGASPSANHAWFFWSWSNQGAPTIAYGG